MRIAVTGSHGTGKTTLIDDFVAAAAGYESVPEPYWLLAEEGMVFADGVNTADLEEQLEQSCKLILATVAQRDLIFDRCPLDYLAYLDVVSPAEGFEWEPHGRLLAQIERALQSLDLIVFVPVGDDIKVTIEHPALRRKVDARLHKIVVEDDLVLLEDGPNVLEISGSRAQRVEKILNHLKT
ncbi:ATP/GTP-binding protein [Neogemmobacter tilapiae]|uniref:NadR/Ttd14 AAA domain-containing protein n=1 Tax=Neogemmobacter tilapiae TaxID=875041 RepID=A0A918WL71_9RHOB|nr:ATP-binding protein [Gemmobacter tilapiae]GHC56521.1 hypothetical protein GCM10007315_19840 [Gemmobacter tilapiae]